MTSIPHRKRLFGTSIFNGATGFVAVAVNTTPNLPADSFAEVFFLVDNLGNFILDNLGNNIVVNT